MHLDKVKMVEHLQELIPEELMEMVEAVVVSMVDMPIPKLALTQCVMEAEDLDIQVIY